MKNYNKPIFEVVVNDDSKKVFFASSGAGNTVAASTQSFVKTTGVWI